MTEAVLEVRLSADGWEIRCEDRRIALPFDSQAAASQMALETAQALQRGGESAEVVIRREDGAVQARHAFPFDPAAASIERPPRQPLHGSETRPEDFSCRRPGV